MLAAAQLLPQPRLASWGSSLSCLLTNQSANVINYRQDTDSKSQTDDNFRFVIDVCECVCVCVVQGPKKADNNKKLPLASSSPAAVPVTIIKCLMLR